MSYSNRFMTKILVPIAAIGIAATAYAANPSAANIFYVNKANTSGTETGLSWATAFTTLQPAIDSAAGLGNAEVWVAQGTYDEWRVYEGALWLRSGVSVYGGFAGSETARDQRGWKTNLTVIHGGKANGGIAAAHVIAGADNAALDGFIIRGGRGGEGAGLINQAASPAISNCVFLDNRSDSYGGAVLNTNGSSPVFTGCWFVNNYARTAGGAMASVGAAFTAEDCRFRDNGAGKQGGAVYVGHEGTALFGDCRFSGNQSAQQGGAVFVETGGDATIDFCRFLNNSAGTRGGAVFANDQARLITRGTLYAVNEAKAQGGAIAGKNCSPTLAGCTFADNLAAYRGGALYNYENAQPLLADCLLWNNLPDSVGNIDTSAITAYYSDIQFYPVQDTNFSADPLFADPDIGNYRLLPGSPCIDTGLSTNPEAYGAVHLDRDGQERGYDGDGLGRVTGDGSDYDIGCDEFTGLANVGVEEPPDEAFWQGAGEGEGATEEGEGTPQEGEPAPSVVYVDKKNISGVENGASWQHAFAGIQAAIDYAQLAGIPEVWVAAGTYDEARANEGSLLMLDGINLYGGFTGDETTRDQRDPATNITIIDGSKASEKIAAAAHVILGANAVLDGFAIRGGQGLSGAGMFNFQVSPTVRNCTFSGNAATDTGGAMFNFGGAAPNIEHCLFQNNSATNNGGAVFNIDAGPVFTDCSFSNNTAEAGGAIMNMTATPVFSNCLFAANNASNGGGAVSNLQADTDLRGCRFLNNQAGQFGGAIMNNQSSPIVDACQFYANTSNGVGGAIMNVGALGAADGREAAPVITNCVLAENRAAQSGGAMMSNDGDPMLVNCTIYGNLADISGGGIANLASRLEIANSILWNNQGEEILLAESTAAVSYSLVQGSYPGAGNFQAAPEWVNPSLRDFHLRSDSPCIDTGIDASGAEFGLVTRDFEGDSRPFGTSYDIGADEYTGAATEGEGEGQIEGQIEGQTEGEGQPEGMPDGEGALEGEGQPEGEGAAEGEGQTEGEGEGAPSCELDSASIDFPMDGSMILIPQNSESAPLTIAASVNCYEDIRTVEITAGQVLLTGILPNPYTATLGDIAELAMGTHALSLTAYGRGYGVAIADASGEFLLSRAVDSVDFDANGYPDNPFQVLPVDRDTWFSCVLEAATEAKRMVQVTRWQRSGQVPPLPVQLVMASPYDDSRRIVVSAPETLLEQGEIGMLLLSAAPDLFTLLGADEAPQLGGVPSGDLVFGAQYMNIAVVTSTDNGATYQPIDPLRVAGMPIEFILQGVRPPVTLDVALYLHPSTVVKETLSGMQVRSSEGTWSTANALNVDIENDRISAELTETGVIAPYAVPYNQGLIGVSPSRLAFNPVSVTRSASLSFTVVNLGTGILEGGAVVPAPFSVTSGASYQLQPGESQKVTVTFTPPDTKQYSAVVSFTGGGGANRTVTGSGKALPKLFYFIGCAAADEIPASGRWADLMVMLGAAAWLAWAGRGLRRQAAK